MNLNSMGIATPSKNLCLQRAKVNEVHQWGAQEPATFLWEKLGQEKVF